MTWTARRTNWRMRFEEEYPEASKTLRNDQTHPSPIWRLAECLTSLQGRKSTQGNVLSFVDSALLISRPNGLAAKRTVIRALSGGSGRKKRDVRSLVFTDAVLDYLVHLHVLRNGTKIAYRPLAFTEFLSILKERYGFCVDVASTGLTASNDLLQQNRAVLEAPTTRSGLADRS